MSVASTDLVIYGSLNIQTTDTGTQGGGIDTTVRYIFDSSTLPNTLADTVKVTSSASGDTTQTVTVTGRNSAGSIVSEVLSLNGTSLIAGATTFQTLLKIVISASHTGTVTVTRATGGTVIVAIETGVLTILRPFYGISSDVSGGSSRSFYEKIFFKNNHGTLSLLSAVISEQTDAQNLITFDLESSVNGTNSIASRLNTAPTSMLGSFDSNAKNCPGTDLAAGSKIGAWLKITLPAGNVAVLDTYTIRITGSST